MTVKVTFEADDPFELTNAIANIVAGQHDHTPEQAEETGDLVGKVAAMFQKEIDSINSRLRAFEDVLLPDHQCEPFLGYWDPGCKDEHRAYLFVGNIWLPRDIYKGEDPKQVKLSVGFCKHCGKVMVKTEDVEQEEVADEQTETK